MPPFATFRRALRTARVAPCALAAAACCWAGPASTARGDAARSSPKHGAPATRPAPVIRPADEHAAALRGVAMLDLLMLARQVAEEADIDAGLKRELLRELDAAREKFVQTIRDTAGSPFKEREEAVKAIQREANRFLQRVQRDDKVREALGSQSQQIRRELDLLREGKERFAATGLRAALDARQTAAVDALFARTALELSGPAPDDGSSPREYRMHILLAARAELRSQLADWQWHKLATVLAQKDAAAEAAEKAKLRPRVGKGAASTKPAEPPPPGPL